MLENKTSSIVLVGVLCLQKYYAFLYIKFCCYLHIKTTVIITPWNITSKWLSYLPLLLHEKWRRKHSVISLVILTVSHLDSCLMDASWYKHYLTERSIMCRSAIQDMKCFLVSFWTRNLRIWFYYHCESIENFSASIFFCRYWDYLKWLKLNLFSTQDNSQ